MAAKGVTEATSDYTAAAVHQQVLTEKTKQEAEETHIVQVIRTVWPKGTEVYKKQLAQWPRRGKHILATFDDTTIIVYQAYCPEIAEAAVRDQRFGGGGFKMTRMSWIKTNFLWMMYRCGWCRKHYQEHVLAVRITLDGFKAILGQAQKKGCKKVRLQWDPDHSPSGDNVERRAIQLGLTGEFLEQYATTWIVSINNITAFVKQQFQVLKEKGQLEVNTPIEQVYTPPNAEVRCALELDSV